MRKLEYGPEKGLRTRLQTSLRPFHKACASLALAGAMILGGQAIAKDNAKPTKLAQVAQPKAADACETAKHKMTPAEFKQMDADTTAKGWRMLDNPEVVKNGGRACYGDCVFIRYLPSGDVFHSGISNIDGVLSLDIAIGGKTLAASEPLTASVNQYKQLKGKAPEFRLVADEVVESEGGKAIVVVAVPVAEKGAQPEFGIQLPFQRLVYVYEKGTATQKGDVFGQEGYICEGNKIAAR